MIQVFAIHTNYYITNASAVVVKLGKAKGINSTICEGSFLSPLEQ